MYVSSTADMSLFPAKLCLEQIVRVETGSCTLVLKLLLPLHTTTANRFNYLLFYSSVQNT